MNQASESVRLIVGASEQYAARIARRPVEIQAAQQLRFQVFNLELNEGDLFGYIGPNGSGKTTTMRILATLLQPTWGEASICGHSICG